MMKLRVKTCCGCCDLHTGTLIVGICGILFSVGGIFTHSSGLENIEDDTTRQEVTVGVGYSYLYIIINALLIYGAIKESRYFLLPWLIYVAIGLGVFSGLCIIAMFFNAVVIILLPFCAGMWYVWLCVLSYYHELNPTNPPPTSIYSNENQVPTMPPNVVTFAAQPPEYADVIKGPHAV